MEGKGRGASGLELTFIPPLVRPDGVALNLFLQWTPSHST